MLVDGETVHVLADHPTPPVFDGPEDRNGKHNHDEIRFWADYVQGADYITDDAGNPGGLAPDARFVIVGDHNADPFDGDSFDAAIDQLLDNPAIQGSATDPAITPAGPGGIEQATAQDGVNGTQTGDPAFDTGDFGFNPADPASDVAPGNLRVDYVLPSQAGLTYLDGRVFWPESSDPDFALTSFPTSDHRLVSVDLALSDQDRRTVAPIDADRAGPSSPTGGFLGVVEIPSFTQVDGATLGGLSGISYDPVDGVYRAISDDRTGSRFYEIAIDLADGALDAGDVTVRDAIPLTSGGQTLDAINPDPEGIATGQSGTLYVSSERDFVGNPAIYRVGEDGALQGALPVDAKFQPNPDGTRGVRDNLGFEGLSVSPDKRTLWIATESALTQDGDIASLDAGAAARIVKYDLATGEPVAEYVYEVDPIAQTPTPADAFADSGLAELLALDNQGTLLALERSFSTGGVDRGYTGKIFLVRTQGATDVMDQDSLPIIDGDGAPVANVDAPVAKDLLLDLSDLGIPIDNVEGMTLGPVLADGRQSLILVSDDNFSGFGPQATQFIALALDIGTIPTLTPVLETPDVARYDNAFDSTEGPDPDDPAIWRDPDDASGSVVITTMKNGGLRVYDLGGEEIQRIEPEGVRYNNVDVLYGVKVEGETWDLAVASDRANDTLAIYRIGADGKLADVTSAQVPQTIFGVDDGEATAYGLAAYTSPKDGAAYVFVTQADGATIAQLRLETGADGVNFEKVRDLHLPVPDGDDRADYQAEGIAIDAETGIGYVTVEDELGLLSFAADPDGPDTFQTIAAIDSGYFTPDLEGVAIHYGSDGEGLLIVSSQGDSSFAAFDRLSHDYLGSFALRGADGIDGVEESDGLEIFSGSLPGFTHGLLVTQDGSNDPQLVLTDPQDGEVQNYNVNFKYSDFGEVLARFGATANADYDPRHPADLTENTSGTDRGGDTLGFALAQEFDSGAGEAGAEVVSVFDGRAYVTNGAQDRIDIFDAVSGDLVNSVDLSGIPGYAGVNSVDVSACGIAVAIESLNETQPAAPMLQGEDGWGARPVLTITGALDDGYRPTGVLDGIGATEKDADTVRIYVNHELGSTAGETYDVNGIDLVGARISYFDIDKATHSITAGGIAYDQIVDAGGDVATDTSFTFEDKPGFERFCSGALVEAGQFDGRGLADQVYFAGEETGGSFSGAGGAVWALDTATDTLYAAPALGRGAWENVAEVDTGTDSKVAFILQDDTSPFDADGDGTSEAAPLFLYVGDKSTDPDAGFLARNGLEGGTLHVWVSNDPNATDPATYTGPDGPLDGQWVALDNTPNTALADEFGANGYDEWGYPTQKNLWTQAEAASAFAFSRPEDVSTNPADGTEVVLASTGVPEDFGGADKAGEVYTLKLDFSQLAASGAVGGTLDVLYDGDADPNQTLRSPDNVEWTADGAIYVQEDRAGDGLFGEGAVNPADAGIVRIDPATGQATRVAEIDQTAVSPAGAVDLNVAATGQIDVGSWESSGILDVSRLFGSAAGTLFLADVQAHSLADQNNFDPEGPAGLLTDDQLVEGGQLAFLTAPGTDVSVETPIDPDYPRNGLMARFDLDGNPIETIPVGVQPDMVTYSRDSTQIFVANEGEVRNGQDPAGSLSIINVASGTAQTYGFAAFDDQIDALRNEGVRIFPDQTPSTDFEPEYIAEAPDGKIYVTLQESNAIAVFDQEARAVTDIVPLGAVDHSVAGQGIDPSDEGGTIDIHTVPVHGLRMPDALAVSQIGGETYIFTANEGDARSEGVRIADITLDPTAFPDAAALQADEALGRLEVSGIDGDTDGDGDYDALYSYGARSFTIFDTDGKVVFDSGDDFEQIIAENRVPNAFNNDGFPSDAPDVVDDNRSDNKGPEPEGVALGRIGDHDFAFIGLERDSGIMIYDVTDPRQASFVDYIDGSAFGNTSPEVVAFVPASESATGHAQIAASYEISGTTALYNLELGREILGTRSGETLQGSIGDDLVRARGGADRIDARGGDDLVFGGGGADDLAGGAGDDRLRGGKDADRLAGGMGEDTLDGGAGADRFVFHPGDGHDTIALLDRRDVIDLSGAGLAFDDLDIETQGGREVTIGYGDGDDIALTLASNHAALTQDDFIL